MRDRLGMTAITLSNCSLFPLVTTHTQSVRSGLRIPCAWPAAAGRGSQSMDIPSISRRAALCCGAALALLLGSGLPGALAQQVIKIAVGAPLTGPLAKQGQEVANAVALAVDEWNARGGVLGRKIELIAADDQGNPQIGVAAGERVAADPAVLGTVWGITSITCMPVSEILD